MDPTDSLQGEVAAVAAVRQELADDELAPREAEEDSRRCDFKCRDEFVRLLCPFGVLICASADLS